MIGGLAAAGRRILQHNIFPPGGFLPHRDRALRHAHKPANTMGFVHHIVPALQRQRVHPVPPTGLSTLRPGNIPHPVTGHIRFRHHHQRQRLRPRQLSHLRKHQPRVAERLIQGHLPGLRLGAGLRHFRRNALLPKPVGHAFYRTRGGGNKRRPATSHGVRQQQRHHFPNLGKITPGCGARLEIQRQRILPTHARRGDRPPRLAGLRRPHHQRIVGAVRGCRQVQIPGIHRSRRPHGGCLPPGGQKLCIRGLQIRDPGADFLRVHRHHVGSRRHEFREGAHGSSCQVGQHRDEGLHAVGGNPVGNLG